MTLLTFNYRKASSYLSLLDLTQIFNIRMNLFIEENDITKLVATEAPKPDIEDGYILMAVEKFVLTSNIVTYATAGESFGYFKLFPMDIATFKI